MSNVFVFSDPHFGHSNIMNIPGRKEWCQAEGIETIEQHDNELVDRWNAVVTKRDTVYLLGDIGQDKPRGYVSLGILPRLQGNIKVVGGNHDTAELLGAAATSNWVHGVITKTVANKRIVMTHIPIHPQEMRWDFNVHGHLHGNFVRKGATMWQMDRTGNADPRYICACVEQHNFFPAPLEELVLEADKRMK